jgi:hypothetical protein
MTAHGYRESQGRIPACTASETRWAPIFVIEWLRWVFT